MRTLRKGADPNHMTLMVDSIEINPSAKMIRGMIEDGLVIKFSRYNIEDLLCQLLEDYGDEELIKKIKELE